MQLWEVNFAELSLPLPLHIQSVWVEPKGWGHSNQEIQVWGLGVKCGELCGWNAFLSAQQTPSYTPLLSAPQLTPLWHIQWSAAAVIPTQKPRWAFSTPGRLVNISIESRTEHSLLRDLQSKNQYVQLGFKCFNRTH